MRAARLLPLALGLVAGAAVGLTYAWKINPVAYTDTAPASLRADFRQAYVALIASAYSGSGDLARARQRLALLPGEGDPVDLAARAQTLLAAGQAPSEARALARLAADLAGTAPTPAVPSSPAATPAATRTPTRTPTPVATPTASPTPGAPFQLSSREAVCDPALPGPLIQVVVLDAAGRPVPYEEVLVVWDAGQDTFFTGLKPELGAGYGDFLMSPGVRYTVQLSRGAQPVTGLQAEECPAADGTPYAGSWLLTFAQP